MIWGGIFFETKTELVVVRNSTIIADRYIRPHVAPFAPYIDPNLHLICDNGLSYIANIIQNYLNEASIHFSSRTCLGPYRVGTLKQRSLTKKPRNGTH